MLPPGMDEAGRKVMDACGGIELPLRDVLRAVKWHYIETALRGNRFNLFKTAKAIGMHRNTLARTLEELGMREHVDKLIAQARGEKG